MIKQVGKLTTVALLKFSCAAQRIVSLLCTILCLIAYQFLLFLFTHATTISKAENNILVFLTKIFNIINIIEKER